MLVFNWSQLTPMQYLFFIGPSLRPHNICFSLVMAYTHAIRVFHWSRLTPMQYFFFIGHGFHHIMLVFHLSWFTPSAYPPMVTAQTHAFLVSSDHFVDFICGWMYMSITSGRFIAGQCILHLCVFIYIYIYMHIYLFPTRSKPIHSATM